MSKVLTTDNYKKHTVSASFKNLAFLQRFLIDNFYDVLLAEIKKINPKSVLDAGCGEGITLNKIKEAKIGSQLSGFDFSDKAIQIGKKLFPKLNLKQGDIYKIDAPDNSYDVVICSEVLEHLEKPEDALKELVRVSKKYVILSVPQEPLFMIGNLIRGKNVKRLGNDIEHIQHWSNRKFVQFVSKYMDVKSNITPLPWTLIVAIKK